MKDKQALRFKRIYIEISNKCNLNCHFCSPITKPIRTMTAEEFLYIAGQLKGFTEHLYLHIKGEPLLHPQFREILNICEQFGFMVNITTNGTLLEKQNSILLQNSAVRQVNISVHSFDEQPETYRKNYLDKIAGFGKAAKEQGRPYISYRMWNGAKGEMIDIKSLDHLCKIAEIISPQTELPTVMPKRRSAKLAENVFVSWEEEFVWPSLSHNIYSDKGHCLGAKTMIGILCDGTVVPCCLDSDGSVPLGNIFTQPFSEIVLSARLQKMADNFANGIVSEELCRRCSYRARFD
ncbi:MAG: radical SAM/SPASM domain-containing protein [Oscillospiraceae bacterium]